MIQMMKKPVSLFLAVLMIFSCFSGMGMTAYADNTCTVTFKANGRTVSKEVTLPHTFSCNYSSENGEFDLIIKELYQLDGGCCGLNPPTVSGSTNVTGGISGDNQYITVNAPFEGTATFDSVYFDSSKGYMDFEIHLEISCTGAVAAYSVTITPGSNMTKTSGEASQTGLSGPMTAVVYTANDGYKFPETSEAYTTTNGITVAVSQDQKTITVSGTPTADTSITIPDAVEELLTTITATGKEQANYSTANVATVSFSYTAGGSSAYLANWGWWGYGWTATVTPADGYTVTKCVFYDDANRTATDSEAPFVVETTEEDKTPKVNGTPILADQSKGITKIEVYGYAVPSTYTVIWNNYDGTTLETDTDVEEGTIPTYNGATPTKADDAQYTYTFAGWTPEVVAATQDVTYIAQFTPVAKFSVFVKKLTGGTITVSNVTGLTTVAQLKDLLVTETGVPASAMRLIFAGKQLADDKTLGEYNIQKESTLHLVIRTYTITWKSDENTVIDTTNVAYGATPTHEDPAAYEDADYTYTFAGWTPEVTAVTGEATYTATYTATAKTQPVAEANGVKYESFDEALRAISTVNAKGQFLANGTVRLLADCAGNGYSIASGSNLIIDFNGKTYTVDAEPLAGSTGTKTQAFQLLKNSTVIFKNGTLYSEVAKMLVQNYSDLTLEGMTLTLENPNYYPSYTLSNNNGDTMIIDSTINANSKGGFAFDVCRYASYPSVSVTVSGDSEINGDVEIFASKGDPKEGLSLNLNGGTMSGNIVVDESVKTILQNAPESAVIKKAAAFKKDAPEGYVWNEAGVLEPAAPVNGGSLTLTDGVKFNAYLDADAYGVDASKAVVKLTYNAKSDINDRQAQVITETKALSTVDKYVDETSPYNGTYKFIFSQAPAQMNEDIVIELYANADETGPVASITTSAAELCEAVIASEETTQSFKDLCASLLDYGRAAQIYFEYDLANVAAAYNNDAVTTLGYADMRTTAASLNGIPFKGVSLTALSTTKWNILVTQAQTIDTVTGAAASASSEVLFGDNDAIVVSGVNAADFAKTFTVYTGSGSVTLSAAMIARAIVKASSDSQYQNLARAFYLYGCQAESFFA